MNDSVAAAVWLMANLLLLRSAWLWCRRLFPEDDFSQIICHVLVVSWACVVGNTVVWGTLGALSASRLLASVCATCLVCLALLRAARRPVPSSAKGAAGDDNSAPEQLPEEAPASSDGRVGASPIFEPGVFRKSGWSAAWGFLAAFALATVVFRGLVTFPQDWDSLAYHIPLIDHWLREGTLYVPDCAFWYVPGNNEVLGLWLVAPFSGDYLIALNNLPAAILLAAAAVQLAALFGVSRPFCHLSGMAIVATIPMLRQLVSSENDIAVAALFFATLVYGIRHTRHHGRADLIFASVALGLLTGVKYYALGYAGVAWAGLVGLLVTSGRSRDAAKAAAIGVAAALLFGGYWYLRNLYVTGTPLYPLGFSETTHLWGVMRPGSFRSTLLGSGRPVVWPLIIQAVGTQAGLCHLVAIALLPATLAWLACSAWWSHRTEACVKTTRSLLLVMIVLSALVFLVTPNTVETAPGAMNMLRSQYHPIRFGLCFLNVSLLGLAVVLNDIVRSLAAGSRWGTADSGASNSAHTSDCSSRRRRRTCGAVLYGFYALCGAGVVYQMVDHVWRCFTLETALATLDLFLIGVVIRLVSWESGLRFRRLSPYLIALCAFAALAWGNHALATRWHRNFAAFYDSYYYTDAFTSVSSLDPNSERICVCDYRYYPFFGSHRQYNVCRPLWIPSDLQLVEYIRKREVTLLVVPDADRNPHRRYTNARQWAAERAGVFEPWHKGYRYTLFRVHRDQFDSVLVPSPVQRELAWKHRALERITTDRVGVFRRELDGSVLNRGVLRATSGAGIEIPCCLW